MAGELGLILPVLLVAAPVKLWNWWGLEPSDVMGKVMERVDFGQYLEEICILSHQ